MKTFEVKISWEMIATVVVEAETEQEARYRALEVRPIDGGFVPCSMRVHSAEYSPEFETGQANSIKMYRIK